MTSCPSLSNRKRSEVESIPPLKAMTAGFISHTSQNPHPLVCLERQTPSWVFFHNVLCDGERSTVLLNTGVLIVTRLQKMVSKAGKKCIVQIKWLTHIDTFQFITNPLLDADIWVELILWRDTYPIQHPLWDFHCSVGFNGKMIPATINVPARPFLKSRSRFLALCTPKAAAATL